MSNSPTECDHQQDEELHMHDKSQEDAEYEVWLYFDTYPERKLGGPYSDKGLAEFFYRTYRDEHSDKKLHSVEVRKITKERMNDRYDII